LRVPGVEGDAEHAAGHDEALPVVAAKGMCALARSLSAFCAFRRACWAADAP
jgi:hypothetical protein